MLDTLPATVATIEAPTTVPVVVNEPMRWSLPTRIAFRFGVLYFGLYVLTTQMLGGLLILPFDSVNLPNLGATGAMKGVVSWTATHIFNAAPGAFVTVNTGSGDKTIDWVHAFCLLVVAIAGTAAWSTIDRRRLHYQALHRWFTVFIRFGVASTMVGYGMVKAFPLQMPAPSLQRLVEPYGDFSPMGVLWYSIGASFPYERFAGCMELLGAVLLFIPSTAVLGAMVTFGTCVQIFTLNMTYDVPVKLFTFHLILMCLALLMPHTRRLLQAIIVSRPRKLGIALQAAIAVYIVGFNFYTASQGWHGRGPGGPKSPLYGIWNVEEMRVDGVVRAGLIGDYGRWRRMIFQTPANMSFQRMDNSFQPYAAAVDMNARTVTLTNPDKSTAATFAIQQQDADSMVLDGTMNNQKVRFDLKLQPRESFLLVSRGFHWVQERPFNR
jgi:hypothetical protein